MRIVSVVGARPQFVKMAVVCRAIANLAGGKAVDHRIVHTGQHYDPEMSGVFFQDLGIPAPTHHLGVGSAGHGAQTGEMMKRLEPVLLAEQPDWILLYGDTNSTLAGAIVGAKLGLRLAHVESGLRSFNRRMPEEINRVVADHLSEVLFCPTPLALENLRREGLHERAVLTGDVMYDAAVSFRKVAETRGDAPASDWRPGEFALATVHRAENTDDPKRLRSIMSALERIARTVCPVVLPLHPRTRKRLSAVGWSFNSLRTIEPVSYLQMILLEARARFIVTDSGGVQKEAYFFRVPCITLREETEWRETLENNCNVLVGACEERMLAAAVNVQRAGPWTAVYGNGKAGVAIVNALLETSGRHSL